MRSRQSVQTSRGSAENNTSFSVKFSARVFFNQCQVNSRLVTILTSQVFFQFFKMNWVDLDLTEHQITQTLTLSRLHAQVEQTWGIRLFTRTQHVDWSRQGKSDCLITLWSKQVILPFNAVRFVRIRGVTSWNGSMTNTAWLRSTHRRCFSC